MIHRTGDQKGLSRPADRADTLVVPESARACPTCGFAVAVSKRYCARCGAPVPADAPPVDHLPTAPPPLEADARFVALGRATVLATSEADAPRRADLFAAVADHEAPRCSRCDRRPATTVALRRSRRQIAFVASLAGAALAFAALRRIDRDPSLLVGWVFLALGALFLTCPVMPWWRCRMVHVTACRECGMAQARIAIDRALRSGALLPLSLLWNARAIALDVRALEELRDLDHPTEQTVRAQDPGPPLVGRAGVWLLGLALAGALWAARTDAPLTALRIAGVERAATWQLGGCVSNDQGDVRPVDCALAHDGHIRDIVSHRDDCPVGTDPAAAVAHDGRYYCIDTNSGR